MAYFPKSTVSQWASKASAWLAANTSPALTVNDIATGIDAWTVAHRSGITNAAYEDRNAVDAHIQTALQSIFPNAVFKDAKRY